MSGGFLSGIPQATAWLEAVEIRRSRRSYDGRRPDRDALATLQAHCNAFGPFPAARVVLLPEAPQSLFLGIVGSYGGISRAPSALAFIGRSAESGVEAAVGYTGEAAVLEATRLGLGSCWVGGFFNASKGARFAGAQPGERVFAVSPLGYPEARVGAKERIVYGVGRPKARKGIEEFAPGAGSWPAWAQAAAAAVQVAPSAMHRQPWMLRMDSGSLVIGCSGPDTPKVSKRLDCGIAMLHAELGALGTGVSGEWELLTGDDVGRFTPR